MHIYHLFMTIKLIPLMGLIFSNSLAYSYSGKEELYYYVDSIVHISSKGNQIIADRIFDKIKGSL